MNASRLTTEPRIVRTDPDGVGVADASHPSVHVWCDRHGTVRAHSHTVGDRCWLHLFGTASYSFDPSGRDVVAHPEQDVSDDMVRDVYRRTIVPMILQVQGHEVLHASAVLLRQRLVAFCGISETGKSTFAYGLSRMQDCLLWTDDAVVFRHYEFGFGAVPLPFSTRLRERSARYFGENQSIRRAVGDWDQFDGRLGAPVPVAAVCGLIRDTQLAAGRVTAIRRLRPDEALVYAFTNANCFSFEDPVRKKETLEQYLAFTTRIPFYEIRFRPGFEFLDQVLEDVATTLEELLPATGESSHSTSGDSLDGDPVTQQPGGCWSERADGLSNRQIYSSCHSKSQQSDQPWSSLTLR